MRIKITGIKKAEIEGAYIPLDALLKHVSLVSTGGEAKIRIQAGDVILNGDVCLQRKKKVFNGDMVKVDNKVFKVFAKDAVSLKIIPRGGT